MKRIICYVIVAVTLLLLVINIVEAPPGFFVNKEKTKTITLAFVGDVMLGRNVELLMDKNGHDYPFASTSELFDRADIVVANLEGPIPENHTRTLSGEMSFSFAPYIPGLLHEQGIDIVSLANNHLFDKGRGAYEHTVEVLQNTQVSSFGHPTIQSSDYAQNYIVNNIPFTLIGFNSTFPSFDEKEAVQAIEQTKNMFPEGVLIVFMHWGNEYELISSDEQRHLSEAFQNAGADIIIGSHPHVTQEVLCLNISQCTIFSLGNFIFDQYFSKDTEEGLVVYITLSQDGPEKIEIVAIEGNHSQPRIMLENKGFFDDLLRRSGFREVRISTSTESIIITPL